MGADTARRAGNTWRILMRGVAAAVAATLVIVAVAAGFAPFAHAQEQNRRWFSPLRELFAPFSPRRERAQPRVLRDLSDLPRVKAQRAREAATRKKRKAAATAREPAVVVQQKAPDARIVLVVGDFVGGALAQGLNAAYADNPHVVVIDRTRASSGFVRRDVYDWPAEIAGLIEKEKPAAVLMLLGSNDRQQMRIGEEREPVRSTNWTKEYEQRAEAFAKAAVGTGTPLLWLGIPAFKSAKMTEDMLAFNEIYRAVATTAGAEFIDVWDGFIDENGAFVTSGPDINGQSARLRNSDGINFTSAGKRKLAFYAEKPLAKILGLSPSGTPSGIAALPDSAVDPRAPMPTDRTLPISLNDPELDGSTELLGAAPGAPRSVVEGAMLGAAAAKPAAGRADDFSWPPRIAAPANAGPLPADQATAATR